jgi:hypothetical protein
VVPHHIYKQELNVNNNNAKFICMCILHSFQGGLLEENKIIVISWLMNRKIKFDE